MRDVIIRSGRLSVRSAASGMVFIVSTERHRDGSYRVVEEVVPWEELDSFLRDIVDVAGEGLCQRMEGIRREIAHFEDLLQKDYYYPWRREKEKLEERLKRLEKVYTLLERLMEVMVDEEEEGLES